MISIFNFIIVTICVIILAFIIAKYQQKHGYKFISTFVGAVLGLFGFAMLLIKMINEF